MTSPSVRGTAIYIRKKWAKLVAKEQDTEAKMILLQLSTLPTFHIMGLDSNPKVDHAAKVQARIEDKIEQIKAWEEECLLIGDLNLPVYKPTELPKTRMMQSWFESGKVEPLNYLKVHTMICPASGKGSTLDLAVITLVSRAQWSTSRWIRGENGHSTEQ